MQVIAMGHTHHTMEKRRVEPLGARDAKLLRKPY